MHPAHSCGGLTAARFVVPFALLAGFAVAATGAAAAPAGFQGENGTRQDVDARQGSRAPSSTQRALANDRGATATWNRFGTPRSLTRAGRYLATGLPDDPVAAARRWISQNRGLLGLSAAAAGDLELLNSAPMGAGRALLLRQRFDGLPAGRDGLLVVGVTEGKVAYVSSSLARNTTLSGETRLSSEEALRAAATAAGIEPGALSGERVQGGWTVFDAGSLTHPARARLVAVPTPTDGARVAWETELIDNVAEPTGFASFVDAETGEVLIRESLVDHLADNPTWTVFPNAPLLDYTSRDTRATWCWLSGPPGCALVLQNSASPVPWDTDARTGVPTNTTRGNAARSFENWNSVDPRTVGVTPATPSPSRDYVYPFTDQWRQARCNPADVHLAAAQRRRRGGREPVRDAQPHARLGLPPRLHRVGLEHAGGQHPGAGLGGDPEQGRAQAGRSRCGTRSAATTPTRARRATASPPTTNMFLWQPHAGASTRRASTATTT